MLRFKNLLRGVIYSLTLLKEFLYFLVCYTILFGNIPLKIKLTDKENFQACISSRFSQLIEFLISMLG